MTKLTVDIKVGETLTVGTTTIRLEKKSGQLARLVIQADNNTPITTPKAARMSVLQTASESTHHGKHII